MKSNPSPYAGISTIVNHYAEGANPLGAHLTPIYQTSTSGFPDVATAQAIFSGQQPGYVYTRSGNPNVTQIGDEYAVLEGLDLLRARPESVPGEIVAGKAVSSGMAAMW